MERLPGNLRLLQYLRGASTGSGPKGTENPRPCPLPRDPEHNDVAEERRTVSAVPPPLIGSGQSKPAASATETPEASLPKCIGEPLSFALVAQIDPPIRSPLPQARYFEVRGLHVKGRARAWAERFKEPTTGAQPRYSGTCGELGRTVCSGGNANGPSQPRIVKLSANCANFSSNNCRPKSTNHKRTATGLHALVDGNRYLVTKGQADR